MTNQNTSEAQNRHTSEAQIDAALASYPLAPLPPGFVAATMVRVERGERVATQTAAGWRREWVDRLPALVAPLVFLPALLVLQQLWLDRDPTLDVMITDSFKPLWSWLVGLNASGILPWAFGAGLAGLMAIAMLDLAWRRTVVWQSR